MLLIEDSTPAISDLVSSRVDLRSSAIDLTLSADELIKEAFDAATLLSNMTVVIQIIHVRSSIERQLVFRNKSTFFIIIPH